MLSLMLFAARVIWSLKPQSRQSRNSRYKSMLNAWARRQTSSFSKLSSDEGCILLKPRLSTSTGALDPSLRVHAEPFSSVLFRRDVRGPVAVRQVPVDGAGDAGFEGFLRFPAEFALEFCAVDRVAAVVAGAVGDVGDLFGVGAAVASR